MFISCGQVIFGVSKFFGIFAWLIALILLCSIGSFDELIVDTTISNEGLLWMQIFMERLSNNSVCVNADS